MLTKEEAAAKMDGNEYGSEGSLDLFAEMKAARMVCLFGYSDDVVEVRGYEQDERGCGDIFVTECGLLTNRCEDDDCPYFADLKRNAAKISVFDGGQEFGMFEFRTKIPHALFKIMEDGDLYGSGIVFSLDDLEPVE